LESKEFIGLHATKNTMVDSYEFKENPEDLFIINRDKYNTVVYDLDAFVASILHILYITKEQGQELYKTGRLNINGYKIVYFPKTFFVVNEVIFQNMNQDGYLKPVYTKHNSIIDICSKAIEAKDTAIRVSEAFKYFGLDNNNISSPIKAFLNKNKLDWPTVDDIPEEASELSWQAIKGHWFEVTTIGNFQNTFMYDLNGSYCYELSKIPDIRFGWFVESKEIPDKAILGIASGILETEAQFHPFMVRIDKNNYTPTGKYPNILGLEAIKLLHHDKLGTFKINKGYWFCSDKPQYPYKQQMEWLWHKKRTATNSTQKAIATRLYSALWGIQGQYIPGKDVFGEYFNPFIHYLVEENSRIHVARTCLQHKITPLAIVGDGFITDKKLDIHANAGLGSWKLSKQGKCLITGSGGIAFESNEPPKGLALHYNTLISQFKQHPTWNKYPRNKYSPVTLALALQTDFSKLGSIHEVERSLQVGYNYERMFLDRPSTGKDLLNGKVYNSTPWNYDILATKEKYFSKSG
jgi:hypothetical protein